ncbi:S9 family peptidase [Paraferrimonas sp. SM1919]|uniref:S9 family peptidase n=1 Tax=Paraferrimonas sp. SM1919 TaxID=2662263 RepID=UPI0013D38075|nr:S9 family peptidase [Paraferrimonas sp. SM1919]
MKNNIIAALLGGLCTTAVAAPFDVHKLTTLNKIHSAAVSSDGKTLVYGLKLVDEQRHAVSDLYQLDLTKEHAKAKKITSHKGTEHSVSFSKDNQAVYFISSRSGSAQVWKLPLTGGEAEQVTDFELPISGFKLDNSNDLMVVYTQTFPECDTAKCSKEKFATEEARKSDGREYTQLMARHWDTWDNHARNHLWLGKLNESGQYTQFNDITQGLDTHTPPLPFSGLEEVSFSKDSQYLVYTAKAPSKDQAWSTNYDLWQIELATGKTTNLTPANQAWDAHATFSSDGRHMAYLAMKKPGFEADRFRIMLRDLVTGQEREVAPLWDRSAHDLHFSQDGKTLYASTYDLGQVSIYSIDTNLGKVTELVDKGSNSIVAIAGDTLVYSHKALDKPADLYHLNLNSFATAQLTEANRDKLKNVEFGEYQQFTFKGWNDETVYGHWIKPVGYQEGQKYPIAYLVHGGPQGSFGNSFSGRWNAQLWAGQGYGVVMVDFHGSVGYGQEFTNSISQDWGGKPLVDLKKGMAAVTKQQPWLDKNNACALGGSYGGYMMNWIAGNWNTGFKCLINHAGLFDMRSFYYVTEELWFPEHEFGGPYHENKALYEKFNPINYVENWQTPMLVIHGEKDFRVPYGQGLAAFTYLQRNNIPSKLLMFPEENHWILNQENLIQWYDNVFDWMDTYTGKK